MTGKEFTELVRSIDVITAIKWELEGEALDPEDVKFVFVADNVEHSVHFPEYGEESDMQNIAIGLVINKLMEQIDNNFRVDISMDAVEVINYSRKLLK